MREQDSKKIRVDTETRDNLDEFINKDKKSNRNDEDRMSFDFIDDKKSNNE